VTGEQLRALSLNPSGYWWFTDRRIVLETFRDRRAAAVVNADNLLLDREPFGSVRS